jgi:hypothetical protein
MKKISLLLIILFSLSLYGFDWQTKGGTVQSDEELGLANTVELTTPNGYEITVKNEELVTSETADVIFSLTNRFNELEYIKVGTMTFHVLDNLIRVVIIPSSFTYNDRNYMENVEAGIQFTYQNEVLTYNFRIRIRNMFLKLQGAYINEETLCTKIEEALQNPQQFIVRRDPDYLLSKVEELEEKIVQLEAQDRQLTQRLVSTDQRLTRNDQILVNNIKKVLNESRAEDDKIRFAQIAYHNNELLAGEKPVSKEIIKQVLEMYQNDTSLDVDTIFERMKEKEIEISKKEIHIILVTYENRFPEEE